MQPENYILYGNTTVKTTKETPMEVIATIILIIVGSALLHMKEYKSSNRILPEGYEIDRVKATQDIQKYGKQYYYEQHLAGNMT